MYEWYMSNASDASLDTKTTTNNSNKSLLTDVQNQLSAMTSVCLDAFSTFLVDMVLTRASNFITEKLTTVWGD